MGLTVRAAVFASGRGSNFEVLARHPGDGWEVALLVTDRADAVAVERAVTLGVPHQVVSVSGRSSQEIAHELLPLLETAGIDLILLAGYLRLVPAPVVEAFAGRILNVHPALLPGFGGKGMFGLNVHAAVLAAGVRVTGVTVHRVGLSYDDGPILAQWPVPVHPGDTPERLARRVAAVEHRLFPAVVDRVAQALSGRSGPQALPDPIPGGGAADTFILTATPPKDFP
ncbi:MAG: phosphoribosylglycinamide formyltransferase [Gemmatimonadales bacterium]|nr:MAG: phosphoribosylglycinamide formyltransferase [Gemmatimonadales bacterium]